VILVGSQRAGATNLATHLLKEENDHVTIYELRGFSSDDLHEAFREVQAVSKATKCRQYLFSLSLNPPEDACVSEKAFIRAADDAEKRLGLDDQARAIVFHEKNGRRHAHVVWSRINAQEMKAVNLPYYKERLNTLAKELYLEHGWELPAGMRDRSRSDQRNFTLDDWQQANRSGKDPRNIKDTFQLAWNACEKSPDPAQAFAMMLKQTGYYLGQGRRRNFIAVNQNGEVYSVARQLNLKAKDLRMRFGPSESLPTVEVIKARLANEHSLHRNNLEDVVRKEHEKREQAFKQERTTLVAQQRIEREALLVFQQERKIHELRIREARFRKGIKGLWDRITGEHAKTVRLNELEANAASARDRAERDRLVQRHLIERQDLKRCRTKT